MRINSCIGALFLMATINFFSCTEIIAPDDITAPETPANFSIIGGGDGEVHFRWSRNTEPDFDKYRIYRSVNNPSGFIKLVELKQTEYVDRFLEYDSVYYYYITSLDFSMNESEESPVLDIQPLNISSPPKPGNLSASGMNNPTLSRFEIELTWEPPNISDLKDFRIYRGNESGFQMNASTFLDSTSVTFYRDINVNAGMLYFYKVVSVDKGFKVSNSSSSDSDRVLTSPVIITPADQTIFSQPFIFSWTEVEYAVDYRVFVGEGSFSNVIWVSDKIEDTEINYDGPQLSSGRIYYCWVAAFSKEFILNEDKVRLNAKENSFSLVNRFFIE